MTDQELIQLFKKVHRHFKKVGLLKLDAQFYPYRSLRHTIRRAPFHLTVKISERLRTAPQHIIEAVAHILLARIYNKPVNKDKKHIYNSYCETVFPLTPLQSTGYSGRGRFHDLKKRFKFVNQYYFEGKLTVPVIGWSKRFSISRLGFYDQTRQLLVISRIFDDCHVPTQIIDYLLFHEMLHIKYPAVQNNGRRIVHSAQFRREEQSFPDYKSINTWIRQYISQKRLRA